MFYINGDKKRNHQPEPKFSFVVFPLPPLVLLYIKPQGTELEGAERESTEWFS